MRSGIASQNRRKFYGRLSMHSHLEVRAELLVHRTALVVDAFHARHVGLDLVRTAARASDAVLVGVGPPRVCPGTLITFCGSEYSMHIGPMTSQELTRKLSRNCCDLWRTPAHAHQADAVTSFFAAAASPNLIGLLLARFNSESGRYVLASFEHRPRVCQSESPRLTQSL